MTSQIDLDALEQRAVASLDDWAPFEVRAEFVVALIRAVRAALAYDATVGVPVSNLDELRELLDALAPFKAADA